MINRPTIGDRLLTGVVRPLNKKLEETSTALAVLKQRRAENVEASVKAGGDSKLAAERHGLDIQIEDLEAVCAKLESQIPLEDALLLSDALYKAREADRVESQRVADAKARWTEAVVRADELEVAHQDALRQAERIHGRTFTLHGGINAHRNAHPEVYELNAEPEPAFTGAAA